MTGLHHIGTDAELQGIPDIEDDTCGLLEYEEDELWVRDKSGKLARVEADDEDAEKGQ